MSTQAGSQTGRRGYPADPGPLAPARGLFWGMVLAGAFWVASFVVFIAVLRT